MCCVGEMGVSGPVKSPGDGCDMGICLGDNCYLVKCRVLNLLFLVAGLPGSARRDPSTGGFIN